ncbi:MAG: NfeD family protein [Bacteroidota bacterium]
MKKLLFLLILNILLGGFSFAQKTKNYQVYQFNIREEIEPPVWRIVERAFEDAAEMKADIILIHMNTFGGQLDVADNIRTKILESKIPVYVFIDNNAASAGALISIACDSIYMRQGANIGAASVVNQQGEVLPEKYQSYMRSLMRSTAQAKHRNPDIAEAMVDAKIKVPGINDSGKVVTLTTDEALLHGFCEAKAENIKEVLQHAGIEKYTIQEQKLTAIDDIIVFLINPFVSGILIMIIIGGIYFEFQTPGAVFPILASIIAIVLYFAPHYLEGLAAHWEIIVFIAGVLLLALEIFVIPGFGVTGILGIVFIIAGLILSMLNNLFFDFSFVSVNSVIIAVMVVLIAITTSIILSFYFGKKLLTSTRFGQIALTDQQHSSEGYTSADATYQTMLGKTGTTRTILRPVGKIMIEGNLYDATAESSYIDRDTEIVVTRYESSQLFVKQLKGN